MKYLIKAILFVLILSSPAWATQYYVRDGGSSLYDASNNPTGGCNGLTNAVYPGTGTNQSCAVNNPAYILGLGCDNGGTISNCTYGPKIAAGDTLNIDGDSDVNTGQQAQYEIGWNATSPEWFNGNFGNCKSAWPFACDMANLPAGSDSSHRTAVLGYGTHKPQLWGTQSLYQVMNAVNNHLDIENLDITDHSDCGNAFPVNTCVGGELNAKDGLHVGGDDIIVQNVDVHGIARYGLFIENSVNITFTNVRSIANGWGNETTDTASSFTGTLTFNQPVIDWNGCQEKYPLVAALDSSSNVQNCSVQYDTVVADGIAVGYGPNISPGNWTFIGPGSVSFNTQDGIDLLHGNGTGTINVDKMRLEGNAGNQLKINAANMSVTNNVLVADCDWWLSSGLGATTGISANSGTDVCRAHGSAFHFNVATGTTTNIFNNTVVSLAFGAFESKDEAAVGCDGTTHINMKNNVVYGNWDWEQDNGANVNCGGGCSDSGTSFLYNDGNDGNGSGTCGSLTWTEDYNDVSFTDSNCVGTHDKCATDPKITGTIGTGHGSQSSYYGGNAGITLVNLQSSSPAKGAGVTGLTYWNNSNDYHNVTRTSPPAMGAMEQPSVAANGWGCFFNSDCSSNTCTANICVGAGIPGVGDSFSNITLKNITAN